MISKLKPAAPRAIVQRAVTPRSESVGKAAHRGVSIGRSTFERAGASRQTYGQAVRKAKRLLAPDFREVQRGLRTRDDAKVLAGAKAIAGKVGVALASNVKSGRQALNLIGRQLIGPAFTLNTNRDFFTLKNACIDSVVKTMGTTQKPTRPNDPDVGL